MVEKIPLRKAISKLDCPAIMAFCNPLVDYFVPLKNDDLLKKYNLTVDCEIEISEERMKELIVELPQIRQCFHPGGSAQLTMKILHWLCDETFRSKVGICCGGLGNDTNGELLKLLTSALCIDTRYAIHPTLPTGVRISYIDNSSHSHVTNMGAAGVYTLDDFKMNVSHISCTVKVIYIEGYFITHSFEVAKELVKQAEEKNIIIAFNLNSTYIFKDHHAAICEMVGHAKIVFGNAREMIALALALNVKYDDVTDIPFLLNSLKRITVNSSSTASKDWLTDDGIFIMSQGGSAPAVAVWGKGQSVQVPIVPKAPVIDTTGAGDSFVAGFLAGVLAHWDPKSCLELGCKVASMMLTRSGVSLPEEVPPDWLQ